jgi:hypothetical protein
MVLDLFLALLFRLKKKKGKRMKERPKEAAAGEQTQPYGELFSLFRKTVLPKGRYCIA